MCGLACDQVLRKRRLGSRRTQEREIEQVFDALGKVVWVDEELEQVHAQRFAFFVDVCRFLQAPLGDDDHSGGRLVVLGDLVVLQLFDLLFFRRCF